MLNHLIDFGVLLYSQPEVSFQSVGKYYAVSTMHGRFTQNPPVLQNNHEHKIFTTWLRIISWLSLRYKHKKLGRL